MLKSHQAMLEAQDQLFTIKQKQVERQICGLNAQFARNPTSSRNQLDLKK